MAQTAGEPVEIIPVKIDLRKKAPPIPSFRTKSDPVAAAEAAIDKLSFQFKNWMVAEVNSLDLAWKSIKTDGLDEETFDQLFRASHDIRGQAETYGFPLAGQVATSLCLLMETFSNYKDMPLPLMEKHVQAMCAIVHEKPEEENAVGKNLVAALREITGDLLANPAP